MATLATETVEIFGSGVRESEGVLIDDHAGAKMGFTTNCAFGGPGLQNLFIANLMGQHFCRVRTPFRGHPLYHQR